MSRRSSIDDSGAIAVLVAVFALVMFCLAAIVVDLGNARAVRRQAQSTADSSALAAATQMILSSGATKAQAVARAHEYATTNLDIPVSAWSTCVDSLPAGYSVYSGTERCVSFDDSRDAIRVRLPNVSTPTFFSGLVGGSPDVSAAAEASWADSLDGDCTICVLGDYTSNGKANLDANGQSMAVGGSVTMNGANTSIDDASVVSAVGNEVGNLKLNPTTTPTTKIDSLPDPLGGLPLPADGATVSGAPSGVCPPGVYFTLDTCTSFTTNGLYQVTRPSKINGNGSFATNIAATFFFTCDKKVNSTWVTVRCADSSAHDGGSFTAAGNGVIELTGSTSGTYKGLALVYDRDLKATITTDGNGQLIILGAGLYGRSVDVTINGGGNTGGLQVNGPVVVDDVTINGGGAQGTVFTVCNSIPNACGSPFTVPGKKKPPNLIK